MGDLASFLGTVFNKLLESDKFFSLEFSFRAVCETRGGTLIWKQNLESLRKTARIVRVITVDSINESAGRVKIVESLQGIVAAVLEKDGSFKERCVTVLENIGPFAGKIVVAALDSCIGKLLLS